MRALSVPWKFLTRTRMYAYMNRSMPVCLHRCTLADRSAWTFSTAIFSSVFRISIYRIFLSVTTSLPEGTSGRRLEARPRRRWPQKGAGDRQVLDTLWGPRVRSSPCARMWRVCMFVCVCFVLCLCVRLIKIPGTRWPFLRWSSLAATRAESNNAVRGSDFVSCPGRNLYTTIMMIDY